MRNIAIRLPRGVQNSLWSVLDTAIYPVVYLATVPIMMHNMGMAHFGFWILLNSIITILQLFNFNSGVANLGVVAIRNLTYAKANNDDRFAADVINCIFYITILLVIAVTAAGWCLSYIAVRLNWWDIKDVQNTNISLCIFLAAIIAGLKYFDQLFQSILKANERFKLSSVLNMSCRFGSLAVTLLLVLQNGSLVQILNANILFLIVYLFVQFLCVRRLMPSWRFARVVNRKLYKQLLQLSTWPWLQTVIIVLTFQTDRFWVSSYAGIKEVSGYGLISTMFNHIHMIITAMAVWIMPRMALMESKNNDPAKLYSLVRSILFGIIMVSLLSFYFISPVLFGIWLGADTYARTAVYIRGFIAFEIVFAHTIMPFFYLNATGKERMATIATLFYCGVCYLFMVSGLFLFHSPTAMIAGMTIAMCLTMPVINAVVQQKIYGSYSWQLAIMEMLPMYAAIGLIYARSNIWQYVILIPIVGLFLWKFYLSTVFKNRIWQQII